MGILSVIEAVLVIPTSFFLAVIFSQLLLAFFRKRDLVSKYCPSVSVLIPAHNEGEHIEETIESVLGSGYPGRMEIVVIDDGSEDGTTETARRYERKGLIRYMRTNHIGKSRALNRALQTVKSEVTVVIDGDSRVGKGSLERLVSPLSDKRIAATSGAIKVANPDSVLSMFQRVEYLYFSFFKTLCDKIGGSIFTNGTLSAFRTGPLKSIGGFSPSMLSEDIDVALRLIRKGYRIKYVDSAVTYTNVPEGIGKLIRQRIRWTRGVIQIFKKHKGMLFRREHGGSSMYSLPLLFYYYFHSVFAGTLLALQIAGGYLEYFYFNGTLFSPDVAQYFFYWFSVFGIINLAYQTAAGNMGLSVLSALNIALVAVMYFLYVYSMIYFRERLRARDVISFVFFFPYWMLLMVVQLAGSREWVFGKWRNWWKK